MRLPLLIATGILSLVACAPLNSPNGGTNNIYVSNFLFTPVIDSGTALKGDTLPVTFRWADSVSGIPHTIVWDSAPGPLPGDVGVKYSGSQSYVLTPGRYVYHCSLHGGDNPVSGQFGMGGLIVIVPFDTPVEQPPAAPPISLRAPVLATPPAPTAARASPPPAARQSPPATS